MSEIYRDAIILICGFGWGIVYQAWLDRRERRRSKEGRIVFDIPFPHEQTDQFMAFVKSLAEHVIK